MKRRKRKKSKRYERLVLALKRHPKEVSNPWALAHWMQNRGYRIK